MNNKKEIIKLIILIIIILGIIIYFFISYKNTRKEYIYSNIFTEEIVEEINSLEEDNKVVLGKIKVYVTGEVNNPGVIELEEGARIEDAINLSGGATIIADLSKVNLAYTLEDGQKLYIPSINDEEDITYLTKENGDGVIEENEENNEKININTASISELTNLPGVGEALAQRIIDYRNENGKFKDIEDLKNVSGIGDKKFESLKEYIIIK